MYKHHEETVQKIVEKLKNDHEILGILLCGSIAHGFETAKSDVDIMMITSEENYQSRTQRKELTYWNNEICTYDDGYVDGKYISIDFMKKVAEIGSEPARFAFHGATILYSTIDDLEELLQKIISYPVERKEDNIKRFYAQFEAWKWYCDEALKHDNDYLLNHSINNLILFGGRLVLAYNEALYPYHKWFMRVLTEVENKPKDLMSIIDNLLSNKNKNSIEEFYRCILDFNQWSICNFDWPNQFAVDSELNWINGSTPIADI